MLQPQWSDQYSAVAAIAGLVHRSRSTARHRHQRAHRAAARKQLRRLRSTGTPLEWWHRAQQVIHHHSQPFREVSKIFQFSSPVESMPQKWSCSCGCKVPLTMSYCGTCGRRWDKVSKPTGKPKKPQDSLQTPPVGASAASAVEFRFPSVGVQLPVSQSSQHSPSVVLPIATMQPGSNASDNPPKSYKALLHQRANRIGKVESRIEKLERALTETKDRWPRFVHELQQAMQREHRKCVDFQTAVNGELVQLRQELNVLLTQDIAQAHAAHAAAQPPIAPSLIQQVQMVLESLPQVSQMQQQATYSQSQQMEVDTEQAPMMMPQPTVIPGFTCPNIAEEAPNLPQMTEPSMNTQQGLQGLIPNMPVMQPQPFMTQPMAVPEPLHPPPGNWGWPPNMPVLNPTTEPQQAHAMTMTADQGPLQSHGVPTVPTMAQEAESQLQDQVLQHVGPVDPQFMHTLQEAAQGLNDLPQAQGGGGGMGLNAGHIQQLIQFAKQQQQCQENLKSFRQDMQTLIQPQPLPQAVGSGMTPNDSVQAPPTPVTPIHPTVETPATPVIPADTMSIHSSPDRASQGHKTTSVQHFQMSPPGQRQPKISKTGPGPVHDQANALTTQVPSSDGSHSPTPVPTEIPSEDGEAEAQSALQSLE